MLFASRRRFLLCPKLKRIYSFDLVFAIQRTFGPHHHADLSLFFLSKLPRDRADSHTVSTSPSPHDSLCAPMVLSCQVLARTVSSYQVNLVLLHQHLRSLPRLYEKERKKKKERKRHMRWVLPKSMGRKENQKIRFKKKME